MLYGIKNFLGHGPRSHPGCGFPGRSPAAAPVIPDTIFGLIGKIPMAGPEYLLQAARRPRF